MFTLFVEELAERFLISCAKFVKSLRVYLFVVYNNSVTRIISS